MLYLAVPAEGPVEGIVFVVGQNQVLGIHGAAEELDAVIGTAVYLDIIDHCAAACALEGNAIQFVSRGNVLAWVFDDDVAQYTAAVSCIVAAVLASGTFAFQFAQHRAGGTTIDRRVAIDDQAAPATARSSSGIGFVVVGEDDWRCCAAVGHELGAAADNQEVQSYWSDYLGACVNGQRCRGGVVAANEYCAIEQVDVVCVQVGVAGQSAGDDANRLAIMRCTSRGFGVGRAAGSRRGRNREAHGCAGVCQGIDIAAGVVAEIHLEIQTCEIGVGADQIVQHRDLLLSTKLFDCKRGESADLTVPRQEESAGNHLEGADAGNLYQSDQCASLADIGSRDIDRASDIDSSTAGD